jgi:hypothetical protein
MIGIYLNKTTFFAFVRVVSDMTSTMINNTVVSLVNQFTKMASIKRDWIRPIVSFDKRVRFIEFGDKSRIFPHSFIN